MAEKTNQVFKEYFVSVLCGVDTKFLKLLWCRILQQTENQVNLPRKVRVDPRKSSFEILNGKHNYNANLFALLGCAVKLHVVLAKEKCGKPT